MTTIATKTQDYDLAGNVTLAYSADRGTSYTYRWDHHNRLTGVYDSTNTTRKAAFTWDALSEPDGILRANVLSHYVHQGFGLSGDESMVNCQSPN